MFLRAFQFLGLMEPACSLGGGDFGGCKLMEPLEGLRFMSEVQLGLGSGGGGACVVRMLVLDHTGRIRSRSPCYAASTRSKKLKKEPKH